PEDAALVKQTIERASQDGKNFEHEYRLLMPDGSVKHVHVVAHALSNESGSVEFVGAVMDVTAAKEAEDRIRLIINAVPALIWTARADGRLDFISQRWLDYAGIDTGTIAGGELGERTVHPDDIEQLQNKWRVAVTEGNPFEAEIRVRRFDGEYRWFLSRACPLHDRSGHILGWYGNDIDIEDRTRAVALRDGESRILEMIARDAPLEEILEKLVRVVEAQFAGLLCSVLLLDEDGQHVRHGAAPSLPKPYTDAIDGLCIGPKAGSCGTAMYRREPVVVSDILQDPLWEAYRSVAEPYGFRACWSTPILAHSGKALGSFAMYYCEPRSPSPAQTRALEMATHLAGIAIERKLAREERERLRQAQAELAHVNRVTMMGELTASLAHEVNQPIAAASTNANTCLRWLAGDTPDIEEARAAVMRIVKDGKRAAEIISRTRQLFKKDSSQRELVDVNEIILEMTVLLRGETTRFDILVATDLAADLPKVMADRV